MQKNVRKPLAILMALLLLASVIPMALAANNGSQGAQGANAVPLTIEVKSDRDFYTLFSTIEFTASVTNTSNEDVRNVSAEVLLGEDLSPLEAGKGKTYAEASTLKPGEMITFTFKAQVNTLKSWDVILSPLMMLLRENGTVAMGNNGFEDGRACESAAKKLNLLSLFASKYDIACNLKVYYGEVLEGEPLGSAEVGDEVNVLTPAQSENFINNAKATAFEDDLLTVNVPSDVAYKVGDIFMVRPTDNNPLGLTGKVVSVSGNTSGDTIGGTAGSTIVISQPELDEVFDALDIDVDTTLTGANMIAEEFYLDPVNSGSSKQSAPQASGFEYGKNFSKVWDLNHVLYNDPNGKGQITVGGKLGFNSVDVALNADLDFKNLGDLKFEAKADMDLIANLNFRAATNGNMNFGLTSADSKLSQGIDTFLGTFTLGGIYTENKIPLARVIFDVGTMSILVDAGGSWAPTMLAVSLELTTTLGGNVEGHLEMGVNFNIYMEAGFSFANGKADANITRPDFGKPNAYIDAKCDVDAQARIGVDVAFYVLGCKLAAITNDVALFAEANADLEVSTDTQDNFDASGSIALKLLGEAQFALKAKWENKLFNLTIIDVDKRWMLYDFTIWEKDFAARVQIADFNGHTYAVFNLTKTWDEAKAACEKLGGHLVTVTSAEEQAYLAEFLNDPRYTRNFYWTGGRNVVLEGTFDWITGEPAEYTNWDYWDYWNPETQQMEVRSEPNGAGGYIGIWKDKSVFDYGTELNTWIDAPAHGHMAVGYTNGFICEWDA